MVITVEAHKIAYMALPKAACSSVKAALAQIDETERSDRGFTCNKRWHAMYPTRRFRPHRWEQYGDDWYRFCVVRDPVQRLISCYLNRVVAKKELFYCRDIKRGNVDLSPMPGPDAFFQKLKKYMATSSVVRHHALPSRLFVGRNLDLYDDVFTNEQLPQLGEALSNRSGQKVVIARENATAQRLTVSDLSSKTRDILGEILAEEYSLLSRYFENPFETSTPFARAA